MSEWIYGRRTVFEHLEALPATCKKLMVAQGAKVDPSILSAAAKMGLRVDHADRTKLDNLSEGGNHQGVCMMVGGWSYADPDDIVDDALAAKTTPIIFALDCIQDPRNLGAILRVADAVGAAGVVIPKDRAAQLSASVARSSAGAAATVKVAKVTNMARALREFDAKGFFIMGAAGDAQYTLHNAPATFPLVLVVGAEGKGLRPNVAAQCSALVSLPMLGSVSSLNVSVAAGVFAYEMLRRLDL